MIVFFTEYIPCIKDICILSILVVCYDNRRIFICVIYSFNKISGVMEV